MEKTFEKLGEHGFGNGRAAEAVFVHDRLPTLSVDLLFEELEEVGIFGKLDHALLELLGVTQLFGDGRITRRNGALKYLSIGVRPFELLLATAHGDDGHERVRYVVVASDVLEVHVPSIVVFL